MTEQEEKFTKLLMEAAAELEYDMYIIPDKMDEIMGIVIGKKEFIEEVEKMQSNIEK